MTTHHSQALAAGLSPREAARWIAYLDMKARRGEQPISLDEAVRQVRAARPNELNRRPVGESRVAS